MRQLHPSYENFIKKQQPMYEKTFMEWYAENYTIGEQNLLQHISKLNQKITVNEFGGMLIKDIVHVTYYRDYFTKKLQLCETLISFMIRENITYELDKIANVMDSYEDLIEYICSSENICVGQYPNGIYNGMNYTTEKYTFENINALKEELKTGLVIVNFFIINEDSSVMARYFKYEPLTRNVLTERI